MATRKGNRGAIFKDVKRRFFVIVLLLAVAGIAASFGSNGTAPYLSPEVKFTDLSKGGLQIVPASCPSSPAFSGECDTPPVVAAIYECGLSASSYSVSQGQPVTLYYAYGAPSSAEELTISPSPGVVVDTTSSTGIWSGSVTVTPSATTDYVLSSADGSGLECDANITVSASAPTTSLTANGQTNLSWGGGNYTLAWSSTNASSCTLSYVRTDGVQPTTGSQGETLNGSGQSGLLGTYTFSCTGPGGSSSSSVTITSASAPTTSLTANGQTNLTWNGTGNYTVAWTSSNATSCTLSWVSSSSGNGSENPGLNGSGQSGLYGTYTFTCTGPGGSSSSSATISSAPPEPTLSISAQSTSIQVNQSDLITATYAAGSGDTLTDTYINETSPTNYSVAYPGPSSTMTYTFTPTVTGTYSFAPYVLTSYYSSTWYTGGKSVTITVSSASSPTASLSANPTSITSGNHSTLTWSSTNATACTGTGFSTGGATSGSTTVSPTVTTTYSISCTGTGGNANQSVTVTVGSTPAPTVSITANPTTVASGDSSTITWSSTNAYACGGINFSTLEATSGWTYVYPTTSTTYTITCTGAGGSASQNVNVDVTTPIPSCSVDLSPDPSNYSYSGTPVQLSWTSANATEVYINNIGWVGTAGTTYVASTQTTDYSCYGWSSSYGDGTESPATLTVNPPATPSTTISASSTTILTGQSTAITADFSAGSGDILTGDNIDSPLGTGLGATTNPDPSKTIQFSTTTAGTDTFYAMAMSEYYPSWASYAQVSVTVQAAPWCTLSVSPSTISGSQSSTLSYSSGDATAFTVSGVGSLTPNTTGTTQVTPTQTTTYTGTSTGSETVTGTSTTVVYLTSGTQWTVPANWNSASNTVQVIGGGASGSGYGLEGGGGGGGGAYAEVSNVSLSGTIKYAIGAGGAAVTSSGGNNGGSTYFNGTSCASSKVCAGGGTASQTNTGGSGGTVTVGTGYSGGAGGTAVVLVDGGGGGGAAGLKGAGSAAGANGKGGVGDAGHGGTAGTAGNAGGAGAEWATRDGSGGGGGGGTASANGGSGGNYGAGGGGAISGNSGAGTQGIIVITYTPTVTLQQSAACTVPIGTATVTVACTPTYSCSGNTIQYTNAACQTSNIQTCVAPAYCSSGSSSCLYPSIIFNQTGDYSGQLQLVPGIVKTGASTQIYWNVSDAQSCTVKGTNGDSWSGLASPLNGETSKAIAGQTTYTLQCTAYAPNPNVTETQTVNVTPLYQEK